MMSLPTSTVAERRGTNPFATRYTRPGSLSPLDTDGRAIDLDGILARIPAGVSMIEGPHGHGKTTLLVAVVDRAVHRGRPASLRPIRSMRQAIRGVADVVTMARGGLVGMDGWEQLAWPLRGIVRLVAWWRGVSVLATAHCMSGLPVVCRCDTTPALFAAVVSRLPDHGGLVTAADLAEAFARHQGNLREGLYDLYDRYEQRARQADRPSDALSMQA